jgi:hypothetical protein
MKRLLPLLIGSLSLSNQAANLPPEWAARCQLEGQPFELSFRSRSGDPFEDDMQVGLRSGTGPLHLLSLPAALYHPSPSVSNAQNLCAQAGDSYSASFTAHAVGDGRVLLWLRKDDRPFFDTLTLALVDLKTATLLDWRETGQEIKDSGEQRLTIQQDTRGFRVRLVGEWLQNTGTDTAENAIETWVPVAVVQSRILFGAADSAR